MTTVNCKHFGAFDRSLRICMQMINDANASFKSKGQDYGVKLAYFAGDTPISQSVGGFAASVGNAYFPCRRCYITKATLLQVGKRRTIQHLRMQARKAKLAETLARMNYGVIKSSVALDFPGFNPILQTPFDIMHILLEGVCRKMAIRLFNELITSKRSSISEINSRIQSFDYKWLHKKNRMKEITEFDMKKTGLITTAAQMKTFFILMPFILEGVIDIECDEYM